MGTTRIRRTTGGGGALPAAPRAVLYAVLATGLVAGCGVGTSGTPAPVAAVADASAPGGTAGSEAAHRTSPAHHPAHHPAHRAGHADPTARGSEGWRVRRWAGDHQLEAFTTRASGVPGTRLGLKVSTTETDWTAAAYRIGAYRGGSGLLVWRSGRRPGRRQAGWVFAPASTRTVVAPWRRDLTIDTTDWAPGFYVLRLRTGSGWETQVPYVVTSPSAAGTVALVAPVTTWQAYNAWGGYSLYAGPSGDRRSFAVSFDRPYNGTTGANDYRTAAIPIVLRAERTGVPLSYFTNVDIDARPDALAGAHGYVAMGHDEYWTNAMRQAVLDARAAGTNLAFLSANTMYWRVRLEARGTGPSRLMVGYRHDAVLDPLYAAGSPEATNQFRGEPAPRPENDLLGMEYECYPVDADFVVTTPDWWGFRGTGVHRGSHVPGLVGPEADRVYPDSRSPHSLQVLSNSAYSCHGVPTTSQSVYYTTGSGAGVFSAGTLRWGCALVDRCDRPLGPVTARFARTVTDTVVREFARGPVGTRHPARDNVASFHLSTVNTVPAS